MVNCTRRASSLSLTPFLPSEVQNEICAAALRRFPGHAEVVVRVLSRVLRYAREGTVSAARAAHDGLSAAQQQRGPVTRTLHVRQNLRACLPRRALKDYVLIDIQAHTHALP